MKKFIDPSTIENLLSVEFVMREAGHKPYLCLLYAFYSLHHEEEISLSNVQKSIGLYRGAIEKNTKILKSLGFISTLPGKRNKPKIIVNDVFSPITTTMTMTTLYDLSSNTSITSTNEDAIVDVSTSNTSKKERKTEVEHGRGRNKGKFTVEDIAKDPDWKRAEEILLKYFKPFQLNPKLLTYKNRFSALFSLLSDDKFDFDGYCSWYRVNKYPYKKFNFGLFLHEGMIAEYLDDIDDGDDNYKKTSEVGNKESFKKSLERKKRMYRQMGIEGE